MTSIWFSFTLGCAVLAAVTMLGAWWIALKTGGAEQARAKRVARIAWWGVAAITACAVAISVRTRPDLVLSFADDPRRTLAAVVATAGLIGVKLWDRKETELLTFFASASYLVGILMSA